MNLVPVRVFEGRKPRESDHPRQKDGEVTLADARFTEGRRISDAVTRRSALVHSHRDIAKRPRQGQLYALHGPV